ncbi:uncharacterized protein Bfra_002211 [Botrytis fragariae]|uniref:Uncharacterized protein n=1 Tax=Botrytis fragariae TaxID=1964551 RepID=A0A8H6AYL4_9HELO|nr:uncharacterized protein Bfra_002211 [Botrytis fragariae]KAF5875815.1 hypothetical protein Bfra_002211 [Botrytis fragariae]
MGGKGANSQSYIEVCICRSIQTKQGSHETKIPPTEEHQDRFRLLLTDVFTVNVCYSGGANGYLSVIWSAGEINHSSFTSIEFPKEANNKM